MLILLVIMLGVMIYDRFSPRASLCDPELEQIDPHISPSAPTQAGLWPNGLVPYRIGDDFPDSEKVSQAISILEEKTNVRFVERTSANAARYDDYVEVVPSPGCASRVGVSGGRQELMIGPNCEVGNVVHEFLHTLGLHHETSRADRDKYVQIVLENIVPEAVHSFEILYDTVNTRGPYDYESIMHFPPNAFSSNGKPTIEPRLPNIKIGARDKLSAGDILSDQRPLSDCRVHTLTVTSVQSVATRSRMTSSQSSSASPTMMPSGPRM